MARKTTRKLDKGAIIAIPLGDGRWALAQVYRPGISFFLLVFDQTIDRLEEPPVLAARPILGSWTNDAEIYRENWKLLTHLPVAAGVFVEPEYSVLVRGKPVVESFDGKTFRPSVSGDESLTARKSRSPLLVEDATKAFFGLKDWSPHYEGMLLVPRK